MASWSEFAAASPRLAEAVRSLVHQYGPGLGYLATVRADGGPRVHPVSPVITDEGLFCFVVDSPKRRDLERDNRYALHAFPPEENNDEAYLSGTAWPVTDVALTQRLARQLRAAPQTDWRLFEFTVDVALVTRQAPVGVSGASGGRASERGSGRVTEIWRAPAPGGGPSLAFCPTARPA